MEIPLFSIFTLCTELLVTFAVFFVIRRAYTTGLFMRRLAYGVLVYEVLFNISYMASREVMETPQLETATAGGPIAKLAMFHGIFSLIMFVTLLAFFVFASRAYRRGENFFRTHKRWMITFLLAWSMSVLSGVAFFVVLYLR